MVQCAALKQDGTKCQNGARAGSRYCSSHKGYRAAGRAKKVLDGLKRAREMKKVRARAKETRGGTGAIRNRPAAVKVMGSKAQCAATTSAGSRCKRLPREGSKYCATHKGFRTRS